MKTTLIAYLLDESGSMAPFVSSTLSALDSYIRELKTSDGKYLLTLWTFNSNGAQTKWHYSAEPLENYSDVKYNPRGATPLYDSIASLVTSTDLFLRAADVNVLFVIHTDGLENASRYHNKTSIKEIIEEKQEAGWQFVFLGSDNFDVFAEGSAVGIAPGNTISYVQGQEALLMREMSMATQSHVTATAATGEPTTKTFFKKAWVEADHPRGKDGKFVSKS